MTYTQIPAAPEYISLDLWAANLQTPTSDLAHWLHRVDLQLGLSASRGMAALIMPEYVCAQWLAFAPLDLPPQERLGWLADMSVHALASLAALAEKHGVGLLPGTIPHRVVGKSTVTNRAWFLTAEGQTFHQDKLSLTPAEQTGDDGATAPGTVVNVFSWLGLRVAIIICLDVEYTALWARLGKLDVDLVLIPAKTDMITGYNRVFGCARSRATEIQSAICVVGAVGVPMGHPATDTGVGGAAAFLPCDISVSLDGCFAMLPPQHAAAEQSLTLSVYDLPVGQCRLIRNGGAEAEVNPAAWSAKCLEIKDV